MATDASWERLPEHIVVSVLSYLTPYHRLQAALACKAWHSCWEHPILWRHFVCWFTASNHEKVLLPIIQHGHRIRALVLNIDQGDSENRINACKVLNILAGNKERKLTSLCVEFVGQNPFFYAGQEFVVELKHLFLPAPDSKGLSATLTSVNFSGLDVAFDESLFDSLADNHPNLQYLNIQNKILVCKITPICMLHLVSRCKKLKDLRVFHLSLSDDVLTEIAEQETPCMEHLSILYRRETKYSIHLSSHAWSILVKKIPSLKVTLGFDHTCPLNRISEGMKPEIPVRELRLETFTRIFEEVTHATTCYNKTLEKVVLQTRNSPELEAALVRMAESCPRLHSLMVYCVVSQSTIDHILTLRPVMKRRGTYILKSRMEEGPWVVGAETDAEVEERFAKPVGTSGH